MSPTTIVERRPAQVSAEPPDRNIVETAAAPERPSAPAEAPVTNIRMSYDPQLTSEEIQAHIRRAHQIRSAYAAGLARGAFRWMKARVGVLSADSRGGIDDRVAEDLFAHYLRTPLTSVRALLEILRDNPGLSPAERTEFLRRAECESERLQARLETVLNTAEVEPQKGRWSVDVRSLVRRWSGGSLGTGHPA